MQTHKKNLKERRANTIKFNCTTFNNIFQTADLNPVISLNINFDFSIG